MNAKGDWGLTPTDENYAVQNAFNQAFVDAVRATGGNNLHRNLIVQTYRCNPTMGLSHLTVPNDPTERRLSVEFHYYDPYSYCSGTENSYFYWGNAYADKGAITPDGNERSLTSLFLQVRKAWWDKGLGVIIGEYGCSHHYTTADRATQEANQGYYLECLVKEARRHGFAAFVWDNNAFGNGNEKFGIFERNNNMSVGCPFFVEGIRKGSLQEYEATVDYDESDPDVGIGGKVLWEGEKALNWGEVLQLKISASEFKAFHWLMHPRGLLPSRRQRLLRKPAAQLRRLDAVQLYCRGNTLRRQFQSAQLLRHHWRHPHHTVHRQRQCAHEAEEIRCRHPGLRCDHDKGGDNRQAKHRHQHHHQLPHPITHIQSQRCGGEKATAR